MVLPMMMLAFQAVAGAQQQNVARWPGAWALPTGKRGEKGQVEWVRRGEPRKQDEGTACCVSSTAQWE